MKEVSRQVRVYRVRFNYQRPSRYYRQSDSSGCPSAEFQVPRTGQGREWVVVRETQD